jgi:YggT family protein
VQLVGQLMEPYVGPFRRVIPPLGMLDLSPMAALLVLIMIRDRLLPMAVNALQPLLG